VTALGDIPLKMWTGEDILNVQMGQRKVKFLTGLENENTCTGLEFTHVYIYRPYA